MCMRMDVQHVNNNVTLIARMKAIRHKFPTEAEHSRGICSIRRVCKVRENGRIVLAASRLMDDEDIPELVEPAVYTENSCLFSTLSYH
jgi:hypothetical protein